jgi:hypothetical protein
MNFKVTIKMASLALLAALTFGQAVQAMEADKETLNRKLLIAAAKDHARFC